MNQAAKIVSDSLLGLDFKNVVIGDVVYTIKPPTIKIICRAIRHFSTVDMKGENIVEAMKEIPELTEGLLNGLSCFICGNEKLAKALENGTFEEVKDALEVCFSMMDISAFQCVSSMRNVSMLAARPKQ
ncbi:hypothetical protein J8K86_12595 [Bacteroides fragilis]|jgi:hypothetical protein|uniref:hypothetical protein n=1 Tax=Bacteroides TaxID=816 RepID=UPI001C6FE277|nr:hypothetical protein [Bacteroides fragilis]DAI70929.1 MAG TPA: hypothetical protein [Caudoviricetes sp.]MBW9277420.1 hypothetical protein [Bacteroides fragilis]MBY2899364.1 hypothetical protein [Bacteroides fragilis]MCM0206828.1 hypothetical protein [Bacteroides fragilis]MCM0326916.1 hypothetical protein [Bacteroides fragilis]